MRNASPAAPVVWSVLYTVWHPGLGRLVEIQKSSDGCTRSVIR